MTRGPTSAAYAFGPDTPGIPAGGMARFEALFAARAVVLENPEPIGDAPGRIRGFATILNVACDAEVWIRPDGSFAALCARPRDRTPWPFITSFPDMLGEPLEDGEAAEPGDSGAGGGTVPGFFLQHASLLEPLLLFTAGEGVDPGTELRTIGLWTEWAGGREIALSHHDGFSLFGDLGLCAELDGPLHALRQLIGADGDLGAGIAQASIDFRPLPYLKVRQPIGGKARLGPLELGDAAVTLESPLYPWFEPSRVLLSGVASLGRSALELTADVPMGRGELVVSGTLQAGGPAPVEGVSMAGLPALDHEKRERLQVELRIDPAAPRLEQLTVFVERDEWKLLDGVMDLKKAEFSIVIDDPLGEKVVRGSALAEVVLDETAFEIGGFYPAGPITGGVVRHDGQALTLHGLAATLGVDGAILPDADIEELHVSYGLAGEGWEFGATISEPWSPESSSGLLHLERVRFALRGPKPVTTHLDAQLRLGDNLRLAVSATHHGPGGWELRGSTGPGDRVEVGRLLEALEAQYGDTAVLPEALTSLAFEDLAVSYSQPDGCLSLSGSMSLRVEEQALRVDLAAIVRDGEAGRSVAATGNVAVGGHLFHFSGGSAREGASKKSALIATYRHDPAGPHGPPDVHDLVGAVSPALAVVVPHVKVPGAAIAHVSQGNGGGQPARWLFGARFDAGVDLQLAGDHVPIVKALLGDALTLSMDDLQILVASGPFPGEELSSLGDLSPVVLPATGIGRGLVSATLAIGADRHPLSLPFGGANPAAADQARIERASGATPVPEPEAARAAGAVTGPAPPDEGTHWIAVAKHFGPLFVDRAGVAYRDGKVSIALGVSLSASNLTLTLQGLRVETPLNAAQPGFDLAGIGLTYGAGAIEVSGGLLKTGAGGDARYDGEALIRAEGFTVAALGSYASTPQGDASLFVFGLLDKELGGPSFFHVTGLAAGFGHHRRLKLPSLDQVNSFPLVAMATAADRGQPATRDPAAVLAGLNSVLEVARDENWLAIGVRFTSYEVVKSFALMAVSFGAEVEIDLIGESTLAMPPELKPGQQPVAFARLAERATFIPNRGVLRAGAKLSPDAYILSRDCHLTGQFALASWFKGEHAGDFVVTLGGYHPRYAKPAHYPDVAPVGFTWQIGDLEIKGDMYFALTPSAVMAGGHLDAVWQSGGIRAWFTADADFLMSWKPFHYEASAGVSIGASFRVDLWLTSFTMTIHVGVALQMWGPDFGGTARVDLSVISFSIDFGAHRPAKAPIAWNEFQASFLPPLSVSGEAAGALPAAYDGPAPRLAPAYCLARAAGGLDRDLGTTWVVNGTEFELVTHSVIPAKTACMYFHGATERVELIEDGAAARVEVGPVNLQDSDFLSQHFVVISRLDPRTGQPTAGFKFLDHAEVTPRWASVPRAIWSVDAAMKTGSDTLDQINRQASDGTSVMTNALVGFTFRPRLKCDRTAEVSVGDLEVQEDNPLPRRFWSAAAPARGGPRKPAPGTLETMVAMLLEQRAGRRRLHEALRGRLDLDHDDRIDAVPLDLASVMRHPPVFAAPGEGA